MRFTAYDIYKIINDKAEACVMEKEEILKKLYSYPKVVIEDESFAPIHIHEDGNFVLGTLAQSYYTVLTKFDPESETKKEIELPDNDINDKTFFFLNFEENRIYIQGKRYPGFLNKKETLARVRMILENCLNVPLVFMQAKLEYTMEEIDEIFRKSFVRSISFRHLEGLKIPEGTILHNPKKYLDEALIESYNTYSASSLSSIDLKAQDGEQLSKNPLARIGMALSTLHRRDKVFKSMEIIDDGEKEEIKPGGNESKIIYIPKKDLSDSYEAYDRIMKKVSKDYKGRFDE